MNAPNAADGDSGGAVADAIDRISDAAGGALAWFTLGSVLLCFAVVVLRYAFDIGFIWMQELYVWFHAIVFTGCAGYALKHDKHVRVDVFYSRMSVRTKAWVNLFGSLLMILPWMAIMAWFTVPWVVSSWAVRETSGTSDGMPGLYALKAMLLVMALLLTLQAIALAARSVHVLRHR